MSWKYIFVFAGNWDQFREWCRRTQYDIEMMKERGVHVVYVDRWEKTVGFTSEVYETAETFIIGTFWKDQTSEVKKALFDLEQRIKFSKKKK